MVKIDLTNGDVLRMNLKNRSREKALRDAWYAMSDAPKWQGRILRILSYTGNKYELKISDIKNCEYSDIVYDYSMPEVEEITPPPRKIFENTAIHKTPSDMVGILKQLKDTVKDIFEFIPDKYAENMLVFLEGLRNMGTPFETEDIESIEIAVEAMKADDPKKIEECMQKYIKHRNKKT